MQRLFPINIFLGFLALRFPLQCFLALHSATPVTLAGERVILNPPVPVNLGSEGDIQPTGASDFGEMSEIQPAGTVDFQEKV